MKQMQQRYTIAFCLLLLSGTLTGCGQQQAEQKQTEQQSQAKMELQQAQSVYPFLIFVNKGTGKAEHVKLVEAASQTEMTPLALLKQADGVMEATPLTSELTLAPGEGVQFQLMEKELREYQVKWQEGDKTFTQPLLLKEQTRIETH